MRKDTRPQTQGGSNGNRESDAFRNFNSFPSSAEKL